MEKVDNWMKIKRWICVLSKEWENIMQSEIKDGRGDRVLSHRICTRDGRNILSCWWRDSQNEFSYVINCREVGTAIKKLKYAMASGVCRTTGEVMKGGKVAHKCIHTKYKRCWNENTMLKD